MPQRLRAYREAQNHVHRYEPMTEAIERCRCGALRAAYPDEAVHPKEGACSAD